jgi:hypothetical protein
MVAGGSQARLELLRAVLADAALAFVATVVIGLVIASLAAAGIITMPLAYILLALAWGVAVAGTFLVPWKVAHRHRAIFGVFLALMLAGVGWYETLHYTEPPSAKDIAQEVSKLIAPLPPTPTTQASAAAAPVVIATPQPSATPTQTKPKLASTFSRMILECDSPKPAKIPSLAKRKAELAKKLDFVEKLFGYSVKGDVTDDGLTMSSTFNTSTGPVKQDWIVKRLDDKLYISIVNQLAGDNALNLIFSIASLYPLDPDEDYSKQVREKVEQFAKAKCKFL